jgi:hypothetical protein
MAFNRMYYCIFFLNIFLSCNKNIKIEDELINIKVDIDKEPKVVDFNDYFVSSNVIALESIDESIFSRIDRLCLFNEQIYILDKQMNTVFIFNSNGKFIKKIHKIGKGPQEYQSLTDFTIDRENGQIVLYSDRPYKLFFYDLSGNLIKTKKLNDLYNSISSLNGKIIFRNKHDDHKEYLLYAYDIKKDKMNGFFRLNQKDKIFKNDFIAHRPALTKDKFIHVSFPYSNLIYEYNDNSQAAKYFIDFGAKNMPEYVYEDEKSFQELFKYGRENNYGFGICNFRENDDYITFNYQISKLVIYNKKTKESNVVKIIHNDNMIYGSYIAHNGDDNKFVSVCRSQTFKKQMKIYKQEKKWNMIPNYIKKIDNRVSSEYDNPILLIYTFK